MPYKTWAVGEEVLQADFVAYGMDQVVPSFTTTTQRDTQWVSPPVGALCVTQDTGSVWQRFTGLWYRPYSQLVRVNQASNVTGIGPGGFDLTTSASQSIPAGRRIEVFAHLNFTSAGSGCYLVAKMDGTIQGGRLAQLNTFSGALLAGRTFIAPGAGSHTFNISIVGIVGTVDLDATSDQAYYTVRDVGAA